MASRFDAGDMGDLMRYDDLCARIYADQRMPSGTRELALTLVWASLRDPNRHEGKSNIPSARRILGGEERLRQLFSDDVPRYERPRARGGPCDGPRLRPYTPRGHYGYSEEEAEKRTVDNSRCGTSGRERVDEYDMITGQVCRTWWYCARHKADAERVRQQLAARGTPPPPIPNRGGLLPCYFRPEQVQDRYQWACPRWKPPYHGICANDWPVPGRELVPKRPRLALVVGGLEA